MKTLADLKRDAKSGKIALEMIYRYGNEIPEKMQGIRKIESVNTVCIKLLNQDGKTSELRFDTATLTEYTGDTLTIFNPGLRDLTPEETAELEKANKERKDYETANPYSESFWHMKSFWKNSRFPYLGSCEMIQGKMLKHTKDGAKILDKAVKGEKILSYNVIAV